MKRNQKMNFEMSNKRQKLRDEQEQSDAERDRVDQAEWVEKLNQLLEERLEECFAELKKEHNSQAITVADDASPPERNFIPQNADIAKIAGNPAPSELSISSEPASSDVLDTLAADIEALQIISLCNADCNVNSPSSNACYTSQRGVPGELSSLYPFVSPS